jgi:hypothetical protein
MNYLEPVVYRDSWLFFVPQNYEHFLKKIASSRTYRNLSAGGFDIICRSIDFNIGLWEIKGIRGALIFSLHLIATILPLVGVHNIQ